MFWTKRNPISLILFVCTLPTFIGCEDPVASESREELDYYVESRMEEASYHHAVVWFNEGHRLNIENTDYLQEFLVNLIQNDGSPYILSNPIDGDELVVKLPTTSNERVAIEKECNLFAETYQGEVELEWGNRWVKIYYYGVGKLPEEQSGEDAQTPADVVVDIPENDDKDVAEYGSEDLVTADNGISDAKQEVIAETSEPAAVSGASETQLNASDELEADADSVIAGQKPARKIEVPVDWVELNGPRGETFSSDNGD